MNKYIGVTLLALSLIFSLLSLRFAFILFVISIITLLAIHQLNEKERRKEILYVKIIRLHKQDKVLAKEFQQVNDSEKEKELLEKILINQIDLEKLIKLRNSKLRIFLAHEINFIETLY